MDSQDDKTDTPEISLLEKKKISNLLNNSTPIISNEILESTPIINKQSNNNTNPIKLTIPKNPRNIFNLSPNLTKVQKKLEMTNNLNDESIVKTAYDVFDKTDNSSFNSNYSTLTSKSLIRNRFKREVHHDAQRIHKQPIPTTFEKLYTIFSDPLYVSNLTLFLQIILNLLMILIFLSLASLAFYTIKKDVNKKIQFYINDSIYNINKCKRDYMLNNCSPDLRVPALEERCNKWQSCMIQDPSNVITSKAYFEVIADCMNTFFDTISLKTMLGIGCLLLFSIVIPNIMFSRIRFRNNNNNNNTGNNTGVTRQIPHELAQTPLNQNDNLLLTKPKTETKLVSNVRFNPNVSYSFYEDEDVQSVKENEKFLKDDIHENTDNIEDNSVGNERVILSD